MALMQLIMENISLPYRLLCKTTVISSHNYIPTRTCLMSDSIPSLAIAMQQIASCVYHFSIRCRIQSLRTHANAETWGKENLK